MDIIDKIKALPDGKTLLYAVMTGMQVEGYNSAHFTTDDLKALVAEVERERADRLHAKLVEIERCYLENGTECSSCYDLFTIAVLAQEAK